MRDCPFHVVGEPIDIGPLSALDDDLLAKPPMIDLHFWSRPDDGSNKSEVALCGEFLAAIGNEWTSYPETAGWDILLSRNLDGFQIGIQAKQKLNTDVIVQAIEGGEVWSVGRPGPDCRAVLVPYGSTGGLTKIAGYIGLTIIRVRPKLQQRYGFRFEPELPRLGHEWEGDWFECAPMNRHLLPEYVPDVAAGSSAPLQLTKWKISAMKLAITLEKRGFITRQDFKAHGIDYRRWIAPGYEWLRVDDGRYLIGARFPDFKVQHPRVYAEIAADADKWLPIAPLFARGIAARSDETPS